ncbi:uncharacterized protein M6B38_353840 [Iris pallida]|uniref:PH, RCC1 and FYVE domains-containing protein 1-like n=1 Tax=Iris pallida TaxID=29817 RepID=A0AAX6GPW0_IRIPA|nr:uncharacterized protein M6B38_353840 [Iris pallida]
MAESVRNGPVERDVEQAITTLKKGAYLLKYGRRGKPKFCPFRLSTDESALIWYSGKKEKQLKLNCVTKIIPGQRTAIFQRYPRPDKEYQSFSLIYNDRSLDLICKEKDEAEVWFVGLKALISHGNWRKWRVDSTKGERTSTGTNSPKANTRKSSPSVTPFNADPFHKDYGNAEQIQIPYESHPVNSLGKVFSDVFLYTAPDKSVTLSDSASNSLRSLSSEGGDISNGRGSAVEALRVSLSSAVSSSSQGSGYDDFDALGDVFIWGEGIGDGLLGGGPHRVGSLSATKADAPLPKALESAVMLDVHNIACGNRHAVLVTKQGEVFSWGEESGGRLGHGVDADVCQPKLIETLGSNNIELVACGEYHTCAVTLSGDLYTWGDATHNSGLLGHGSEASHWIPRKVSGQLEGLHVSSVSCGPWHTAVVTSAGQLFTFGDGTFGVLGHGDRTSRKMPREVEALRGMRTVRAACGVWHTAAVVEITDTSSDSGCSSLGKLFTWGEGDKGRLGHGDREPRLLPACVASLSEPNFCQVACGNDVTFALTTSGRVYTMGSSVYGLLGNPEADGKVPTCITGNLCNSFVEEIACGSYHAAILTSKTEVYTWGKGANGRLGHGNNDNRSTPTLVEALKDKQVKSVVCGSNFTAVICLHKWVSSADQSICSGCRLPFGFRRKRHNCYNCGLVFCRSCSSRKSVKASLAPNMNKPYRVCDDCYTKLKKAIGDGMGSRIQKPLNGSVVQIPNEPAEKDTPGPKLQAQLSRLSSVDYSFKSGSRQSKQNVRFEPNIIRLSSIPRDSYHGGSPDSTSANFLNGPSKKIFSASVPSSRVASRSTSPVPSRPCPPTKPIASDLTSQEPAGGSKQANDNLTQEVLKLQLQVEELTRKSQFLEAELEKTSRQLKEATSLAGEESEKCKAAEDAIKSLTAQLKDMAERVPEVCRTSNNSGVNDSHTSSSSRSPSSDSNINSMVSSRICGSTGNLSNQLSCNGTSTTSEEAEWVEQVEPGVYITVSFFPGGGKHLKRVRFSRKRFSEQKAEDWWAENRSKLQEKYNILSGDSSATSSPAAPPS